MKASALLHIQGLCKSFPGVRALHEVSINLEAGEILALMGENGAGKSTLIKVLTGVHQKDGGRVQLDGKEFYAGSPRESENAGISTVYQELNLVPELSIAENITLGRQPTRFGLIDWKAMRQLARDALSRLSLKLDVNRSLSSLSPALQQSVAIARALAVEAKVLVLDEPTSSLDEQETTQLFEVLRSLRQQGLGIIFVTHFLDQVYDISDRITVLRNGEVVAESKTSKLPRLALIEAMLGRAYEERTATSPAESEDESNATSQTNGGALLEVNQLTRSGVVGPVSFRLHQGEVLGIAGLLGSGRSETARMLFGADPPDEGQVTIDAEAVELDSPRQAIAKGVAFCSEDRKLEGIIPNLSIRENIILALQASRGAARKLSTAEQQKLASHYIEALRIKTPSSDTPIKLLSGGNQQKVLLARWMAMQPKVFILDEPTRGIDVGAKADVEHLIEELSGKGVATILISSELEEITRNCGRSIIMRDRKQLKMLNADALTPAQIMKEIAHGETPAQ